MIIRYWSTLSIHVLNAFKKATLATSLRSERFSVTILMLLFFLERKNYSNQISLATPACLSLNLGLNLLEKARQLLDFQCRALSMVWLKGNGHYQKALKYL